MSDEHDPLAPFHRFDGFLTRDFARAMAAEHGYVDRAHLCDAIFGGWPSENMAFILDAIDHAIRGSVFQGRPVRVPRVGLVDREALDMMFPTVRPSFERPVDLYDLGRAIEARLYDQRADSDTTEPHADGGEIDRFVWHALNTLTAILETVPSSVPVWVPGFGWHGTSEAIARLDAEAGATSEHSDDVAAEVERYRSATSSIWLLQCNPQHYDLLGMVAETGELPGSWSIGRYKDDIRPGDRVVFWLSGKRAGVYAIGEVAGDVYRDTVDAGFAGDDAHGRWDTFVPIDLTLDLTEAPILRTDLKADPSFATESIIKAPMAANPHPVSARAFDAILDRLQA